ncbi:threonine--tRNA ligase [Dactylosporangium sp. NBC_01737]|uniref:threonine--tRNA ligase n=1 Tax=Dactylosporangium sp. NBC_01737 TaxID=2975959 RepID=UPI002E13E96C|nr:threonine--tRNA ligase [Dactylosporangium sp. NBC_01737]
MQDHRKLGRDLELFHSDPLVGAGLPLWLPAGAAARRAVEDYLHALERRNGYQHVYSPPLAKREMYVRSGHLPHFADDMFPPMALSEHDAFVLRPSLCPHHAAVFNARGRSYRELPLRIGEIGGQYRAERSGVLGGLSRVRAISLNDGHVFCTEEQVHGEVVESLRLMRVAHEALGFKPSSFRLSLRGEGGKYVDDPAMWDKASSVLRAALDDAGVSYVEAPGEAAFYGPKVDVQLLDHAGRESTLATVQVDYFQPARFDLSYVDAGGERRRPVMVHRSVAGSMERLFAHLIEVHDGAFPAWYAPLQVAVLPVSDACAGGEFLRACRAADLRVEEWHAGSLGARIRQAVARKVPYVAVVGEREAADGAVSLRPRDPGALSGVLPIGSAVAALSEVCSAP